jgi:hydroxyethylthiazole kinase
MSASTAWEALQALRAQVPLIHNITNYVVMNNTANTLLAVGASPAMVHAIEEIEEFVAIADALVVNIGTLSSEWVTAMHLAARKANTLGKPWILDPVGTGATSWRTKVARDLLSEWPTVIRGNASEILALANVNDAQTRGVDSRHESEAALLPARELALAQSCIVAVSGAVDVVTDGEQVLRVANGHPLMTRVTGLGCSATATIGAFLAVHPDPLEATAYGLAIFGLAGELAAERSSGPGTLQVQLFDALYQLDEATVSNRVRIQ